MFARSYSYKQSVNVIQTCDVDSSCTAGCVGENPKKTLGLESSSFQHSVILASVPKASADWYSASKIGQ